MAVPSNRSQSVRSKQDRPIAATTPEQRPLTPVQAKRLGALSQIEADHLVGKTAIELGKLHPIAIDPGILWFRKVCGQVVRTDPVSGNNWGVPGATVHVYDTDVNLFASFPTGSPYGWFYPWGWRREEIGSAVTDACGNFCVWIPRFDIDWVLRWRRHRHCFFEAFRRVSIRDLVGRLQPIVEVPPHPGPGPDPGPLAFLRAGVGSAQILEQAVGPAISAKLISADAGRFGEETSVDEILDAPAFPRSLPHPDADGIRNLIIDQLETLPKLDRTAIQKLHADPSLFAASWVGPFLRCYDVFVPEFERILDVPDITFSVTQDVNGDGTPETIYAEGLFDVRWDAGSIPPVTLHAEPFAFATPTCTDRPDIPCEVPELVVVGHMPLGNPSGAGIFPIVDTSSGYAVRPNRPHPSGRQGEIVSPATLATAPLTGLLEFWGCAHQTAQGAIATHYRIQHRVSTNGGGSFGPWQPIFDAWNHWRFFGNPGTFQVLPIATTTGWYPVLSSADGWIPGDHYLLQWHGAPDGVIEMQLELGAIAGAAINVIGQAPPVKIVVDNTRPNAAISSLAWRVAGSGPWQSIPLNCPTIQRNHQGIEIRVGVDVSAVHLRSLTVGSAGCGASGGPPALIEGLENRESGLPIGAVVADYWHRASTDNAVADEVVYAVPASSAAGAYSFGVTAWSRAFNPGDGHVYDPTQPDLSYNPAPNWWPASIGVAIVD
jgi:hypothetical protein